MPLILRPPLLSRPLALALLALANPSQAETAMDCLPPVPPAAVSDATTRADYRAEIGADYSAYFDAAQAYLRCLEAARANVTEEINRAIADYQMLGPFPER